MEARIIFLFLIVIVSFESCVNDDFVSSKEIDSDKTAKLSVCSSQEGELQSEAFYSYERLLSAMNVSRFYDSEISSWYGGAYINAAGNLVVKTKDIKLSKLVVPENVILEKCEYSQEDFYKIRDQILKSFYSKDPFTLEHIIMFGSVPETNCFEVGLDDISEENISYFKNKICSSPALSFVKCEKPYMTSTELSCASKLVNKSTGMAASLGYRAMKKDGTKGIVTAGHFIKEGQTLENSKFKSIGQCVNSDNMSGVVDAAFCKITNDSTVVTNKIEYSMNQDVDTLSIDLAQPPIGAIINMVGMVSHRKYGMVSSASKDVIIDGKTLLTDAILMTCKPQRGDSGGIVYALTRNINKRWTVGIAVGTVNSIVGNDTTTLGICCKAYLINKEFGIQRY